MSTAEIQRTDQEILDRAAQDDIDAIAAYNPDPDAVLHEVQDQADALFTWDYEKGSRPRLDRLYEKAKVSQWNAQTDLDWSIDVDPLKAFSIFTESSNVNTGHWTEHPDSPAINWGDKEWDQFSVESFAWRLSQFLHGEQGALLCTAKIVETVPWIDAKYYAATQVVDEARHVEVFNKYIDEKVGVRYPVNPHLPAVAAGPSPSHWSSN